MHAFIVRPFGVKSGVDFDAVESELIQPALQKAKIFGSTTASILEAGNIREDMFHLLLTADLVIADLTIHNANVFYELGIRHALRDKRTFLIKSSLDEIPFDLKTDRYLSYDHKDPSARITELADGLIATMKSERKDSPVFLMLPRLAPQDPETFITVPNDFGEEVEIAKATSRLGKLNLLSFEAETFEWRIPALRKIGEVQYKLKALDNARETWEKIRDFCPDDVEANDRLATIYQRFGELEVKTNPALSAEYFSMSDLAIERLMAAMNLLTIKERAEAFALRARNSKTRWLYSWIDNPNQEERRNIALTSASLVKAYGDYRAAFMEDLNHFYSGINALGLLKVIISLADTQPDVWLSMFDSKRDADYNLEEYKEEFAKLAAMVSYAIEAERSRSKNNAASDPWLAFTEADLASLLSNNPARVALLYKKAVQDATGLNFEAAKKQLLIYDSLGIQTANVTKGLMEFSQVHIEKKNVVKHYLCFTGHMIDTDDRAEPRFPESKADGVKKLLKEILSREKNKFDGPVLGISGGACGGDIIFHEVCQELGIQTELFLALPRDQFVVESVEFAGNHWVERFDRLYNNLKSQVLATSKELPVWLSKKKNYSIWERNNLWMLYSSLVNGGINTTLVALWDGKQGNGPGGTEHMVTEAKRRGAKVIILDPQEVPANA